jgi:diguanylate cyclase (GGDEF)-like protein
MDSVLNCAWDDHHPANRWSGWLKVTRTGLVLEATGLAKSLATEGDDLSGGRLANWWRRLTAEGAAIQRIGSVRIYGEVDPSSPAWDLLVTWASDEELLAHSLSAANREKDCVVRFARAVLQSNSLSLLCIAAAQALRSSLEVAGCLVWIKEDEGTDFLLTASSGVDRSVASALSRLSPNGPPCSAWLCSVQGKRLFLDRMDRSPLCRDVEGRLTGGEGGAVYVAPLTSGGQTIGVLELIGRRPDDVLPAQIPLLDQLASLLSLAIERALAFEEVERQASFDSLTGIANHRTMQDFLRGRLSESQRQGQPLGLVMIDVDYFRQFNETQGHDAGDRVLREVAQALTSSIRAYDLAARYGGEEFALILPGAGRDEAVMAAERVREAVSKLSTKGGQKITVSCGVAIFPEAAEEPNSLLKAADAALYQAKRQGRDRVAVYEIEGTAIGHAFDLGAAVLACIPEEVRDEAIGQMSIAGPLAQGLVKDLGLRLGHLDILIGAAAAWPLWKKGDPPAALFLEVSAGDLRPLEPLLNGALDGTIAESDGIGRAFTSLLKALSDHSQSSRSEDAA